MQAALVHNLYALLVTFFFGGIVLFLPSHLYGQIDDSKSFKTTSTDVDSISKDEGDNLLRDLFDNDTLEVHYSYFANPQTVYAFNDTLLSFPLRQYDYAHMLTPVLFNTGSIASPAATSFYRPAAANTFDIRDQVLEPWRLDFDRFIFYNSKTPFVRLDYGLSATDQDDNKFSTDAGLNFLKDLNFSLQYRRSNQAGFLLNDRSRTTNLALGLRQMRWKNRWLMQLLYTYNQFYRQENGGTPNDSLLYHAGISALSSNIPINSNGAGSKQNDWGILMNNEIAWKADTNRSNAYWKYNTGLRLGWDIAYQKGKSLFYDANSNEDQADTIYYRGFNIDSRGLQNLVRHEQFSNAVYLAIGGKQEDSTGNASYLRAGIDFTHHLLKYAPLDSSFSLLKLTGKGQWGLKNWATLDADGWLLLKALKPAFSLQGKLTGNIGKILQLSAWLGLRNTYPGFRYQYLHLNGTRINNTDLKNEFISDFGGMILLPKLHISIAIFQTLGTNLTYFNNEWQSKQITEAVAITGFQGKWNINLSAFHLDNYVQWQHSNYNEIRIPAFGSRHSIYFQQITFRKRLLYNVGFDVRYFSGFQPYGFSPLLQSLYVPDNKKLPNELDADFFISYKIRLLRGFFRLENLSHIFTKKVYYQIYQYPQDKLSFRIGFSWLFNN